MGELGSPENHRYLFSDSCFSKRFHFVRYKYSIRHTLLVEKKNLNNFKLVATPKCSLKPQVWVPGADYTEIHADPPDGPDGANLTQPYYTKLGQEKAKKKAQGPQGTTWDDATTDFMKPFGRLCAGLGWSKDVGRDRHRRSTFPSSPHYQKRTSHDWRVGQFSAPARSWPTRHIFCRSFTRSPAKLLHDIGGGDPRCSQTERNEAGACTRRRTTSVGRMLKIGRNQSRDEQSLPARL